MNYKRFTKILKIFVSKGWVKDTLYETPLDNICQTIENLRSEEEIDLLTELIENYTWISSNEYRDALLCILKGIEKEGKFENHKRIILFPIINPNDENRVKSGHLILYQIKGIQPFLHSLNNTKILEITKFEDLNTLKLTQDEVIFLVDDFLGSGNTFQNCVNKILENPLIKTENLNVISIATQEEAIKMVVNNFKIPFYYKHIEKRGITDYNDEEIANNKKEKMIKIEEMFNLNKKYSLGYEKSEALITMLRTPNNTFPIFWHDYEFKGIEYKAPFPRH